MDRNRLLRRRFHIRKRVVGTATRPRLTVRRSDKHVYALLVDDGRHKVMTAASTLTKDLARNEGHKTVRAREVGKLIAQKAKALGVEQVVFDRGGYRYHGRVKAVAEGAREGGLKF
ncbi:MAG: 50S ribosomal protein L18 [candidate division WOR-3 bacterium]